MSFFTRSFTALAFCVCLLHAATAVAQTDYSERTATSYLTVGAGFSGGASVATQNPATGFKIGPVFAYRLGANAMYPLTKQVSATLDLGLDRRGNKVRNQNNTEQYLITNIEYLSFTPGVRLSAFWIGFNLGVPTGGNHIEKRAAGADDFSYGLSTTEEQHLGVMFEPRMGVAVPIVEEKTWWAGLNFTVGYCLNNFRTDLPTSGSTTNYNGSFGSVHLGITVQYAIPGTGKQ